MLDADFEVRRRDFPVTAAIHLDPGERLALLGASGAGKTTVLEAIAGFLPLSSGEIRLQGRVLSRVGSRPVPPRHRGVGVVGGSAALFPHLSVLQNVCYSKGTDPKTAVGIARTLGLGATLNSRPGGLSEGERRRVALARTLAAGCQVLCLDEPFIALDRLLADELLELVRESTAATRVGTLLVTHRLEEAQAFAEQIGAIDRGRIVQLGPSQELLHHPRSPQVARLMGYRGWARSGGRCVMVHPELSRIDVPGELTLSCQVAACRPFGARFDLELEAKEQWRGRFHLHWRRAMAVGSEVRVGIPDPVLFSASEAIDGES